MTIASTRQYMYMEDMLSEHAFLWHHLAKLRRWTREIAWELNDETRKVGWTGQLRSGTYEARFTA